jgi:hypothetical protein
MDACGRETLYGAVSKKGKSIVQSYFNFTAYIFCSSGGI